MMGIEDEKDECPWWLVLLILAFAIGIFIAGCCKGYTGRNDEINNLKTKYELLLERHEKSICDHRGLVVTTVKGITLCMSKETKALHKIEDEEDK